MGLLLSRRQAPQFKWRPTQFEQGKSKTLPAPYGGINLRDDISALEPNEARVLNNLFPNEGSVEIKGGNAPHAVGMGTGEVKTLAGFVGFTTSSMLAGADGKIFDVTSATYDPGNDTFTKVYLQLSGADGGTVITDSNVGGSAHTWTAAGNANTDNAQFKFGPTSLALDGTGDWVTTADHADYTLGSSDFTVDFWFNCTATTGSAERLAGQAAAGLAAATGAWYIERHTTDVIRAHLSNGSAFTTVTGTTAFTDAVNTGWHHVAFVRTGNVLKLFIDGAQEGGNVAFTGAANDSANALRVGAAGEETTAPWTGWIDEFRFSVGTARWTAAFTPPTVRYAPTELAIGFTEDRWQTTLYSNRLFWVNGVDNPQVYDGSTVAAIAWTGSGLTDNDLINVALVRNRLWFAEKNAADVWYGDVGQITAASALTKFQLSQVAKGGICMAIGSWSRADSGDGADDFTVFFMSTGEVLVYQGDPSTTFSKIGAYDVAPPIGRKCLVKVGGELILITVLGFMPLSAAVQAQPGKTLNFLSVDPWGKVAPGVVEDATTIAGDPETTAWGSPWGSPWAVSFGDQTGWHGVLHKGVLFFSLPTLAGATSKQWVLNTRHGAWATFTGWNGSAFLSFDGDLYWGGMDNGTVYKQTGTDDNGAAITSDASCSFQYCTSARNNSVFTAVRPKVKADSAVSAQIGVDVDFNIGSLSSATVELTSSSKWYSVKGQGKSVSVRLRLISSAGGLEWFHSDVLYKPGGTK